MLPIHAFVFAYHLHCFYLIDRLSKERGGGWGGVLNTFFHICIYKQLYNLDVIWHPQLFEREQLVFSQDKKKSLGKRGIILIHQKIYPLEIKYT